MEFRHLPMPGGLFAQNPGLLDAFRYIWSEQAKEDKKKQEREKNAKMGPRPKNAGDPPR
jgi:hypothetical protein